MAGGSIALTFDDGPGAVTERLLEVLRARGGRATFNVLGERVAGREAVLRRMVAEGHEVGVHGWCHRDLRAAPPAAARELARARLAVATATGVVPAVFRAPWGLVDERLERSAAGLGLATVGWDVDPRDYDEPGAEAIAERVLAEIQPGSIVLLHDDRPELAPTAEAVDAVLAALPERGLQAVTVTELREAGG